MEWIDIKEKAPEVNRDLIFTNEEVNKRSGEFMYAFGWYDAKKNFRSYLSLEVRFTATHYFYVEPVRSNQ